MKHLYTLTTLLLLFNFTQLRAQVTGFAINGLALNPNTIATSCDQTVTIGFSALTPNTSSATYFDLPYTILGNNFSGFQFQTAINWGDATTSNAGGGTSTSGTNIPMNPPLSHTYNTPGTYLITTTVYNPANQTYAYDSISYSVGLCNINVYAYVGLDCDNNGTVEQALQNVPFNLIGSNGFNYSANSNLNTMLQFTGVLAGTYTLEISMQWLINNGYQVQNSVPNSTITSPGTSITTYAFTLICNQNQQQLCATGQVYCDANDNGVLDSGETPLANAPISANGVTTYTNANGVYNLSYPGIMNDTIALSLNANWLSQNGYTVLNNNGNNTALILGTLCNASTPVANVNFPLQCGAPITSVNCFGGYVFCDANGNGIFDAGETPLYNAPVQLFSGITTTNSITVYTNNLGYYQYCGNFPSTSTSIIGQVSPTWLGYNGYTSTSPFITITGSNNSQMIFGNIAINCGGTTAACTDLYTSVTPWIGYYQNSTAYIKLNWGSYGPGVVGSYTLSFTYPAGVSPILSSIQNSGYVISGNTITWNLNSSATNFSAFDVIMFSIPGGLINGAQHYFTSTIVPTGATIDCGTYNNNGSLLQILGNSYDPNDKNASTDYMNENYPIGYLDAFINDALTYTIRFQNTGTAPAQNVYIIDTLSTLLDWSSFTLLEASHPVQVVNMGNGIMRFEFNQIWLPDSSANEPGSHGYISYRINEIPTNAIGSIIENTAYIYFDWNEAIVTNTTFHQNMWLDGIAELKDQLGVYPNPAQDKVKIDIEAICMVQIKDLNGRLILEELVSPGQSIDIQQLTTGIYIIESKGKRAKFIKN
ncbi:MAG: T9SS type A sorting domain-containing protein [Flavobacteriales bacterium]